MKTEMIGTVKVFEIIGNSDYSHSFVAKINGEVSFIVSTGFSCSRAPGQDRFSQPKIKEFWLGYEICIVGEIVKTPTRTRILQDSSLDVALVHKICYLNFKPDEIALFPDNVIPVTTLYSTPSEITVQKNGV